MRDIDRRGTAGVEHGGDIIPSFGATIGTMKKIEGK
jgi:hypothetical protein